MRTLTLFGISIKAALHRLHHDLGRELVVAACAAVLLATFWYVFNDFLNVEVRSLSEKMRDFFAHGAAGVVLLTALAAAQRLIRAERTADDSLRSAAWRLGETAANLRAFMYLRYTSITIICFGIAWYVIMRWLVVVRPSKIVVVQSALLVMLLIWQRLNNSVDATNTASQPPSVTDMRFADRSSPTAVMVRWRLMQILRRNRTTRLCLGIATVFALLTAYSVWRHAPFAATIMAAFACGIFLATAMAFQLAEDLQYAWAERCMGVSHEQFIKTYYLVGIILAIGFGLPVLALTNAAAWSNGDLNREIAISFLKLPVMIFVPCFLLPQIGLQVDGRRPAIQIMMLVLFGLFIVTAIYAHWLSIVILFLMRSFTEQNQQGHFYRA